MEYKDCIMGFCSNKVTDQIVNNPKSNKLCASCRELLKDVGKTQKTAEGIHRSFPKWAYAAVEAAKSRGKWPVSITPEDIYAIWPADNKCPILKIPFATGGKHGRERNNSPSIDRIDNNKGYTPDNIQIVSMMFNSFKSYHNDEDLDVFAEGWIKYRKEQ